MTKLLFLGLGGSEILLIALVALLFFGGKKIPELMSGLGKGVKSYRDALNGQNGQQNDAAGKEGPKELKDNETQKPQ